MVIRFGRKELFGLLLVVISLVIPNYSQAIECYECHGTKNPPDYRPLDSSTRDPQSGGFQGSHRKHLPESATPYTCSICHPGSENFGPNHQDGIVSVSLDPYYPAKYRNGSTAILRGRSTLGSCTNVYCHNDGTYPYTGVLVTPKTPVWGGGGQSCTACHGNPPSYASGSPKANSHQKHLFSCNRCHYPTTTTGTSITSPFNHRNEWYEVGGPSGEPVSYNGAQCYNTYCHGNGTNVATGAAANSSTSPAWGSSGPLACTSCHAYPPAYAKGAPKSNLHVLHNSYGYKCSQCHYATTQNGATIAGGSTTHANRAYDVSGPPGKPISYTYSATGGTCANTYCHSSGQGMGNPADPPVYATPNWNQKYPVRCWMCHEHGYHAYDSHLLKTGSHFKHLKFEVSSNTCKICHYADRYANSGSCGECHNTGTTQIGSGRVSDITPRGPEHADGVVNVAFNPAFPAAGATGSYSGDSIPGTAYGNCANLYCHSQGTKATPPYAPGNIPVVTWGGNPMPADCTGCHGGDINSSIPITTLSHGKHLGKDCAQCHRVSAYNSRSAIPNRPAEGAYYSLGCYHSDGYVEVIFLNTTTAINGEYAGQSFTYGRLAGSPPGRCTNVYCHTNGTAVAVKTGTYCNISTPVWGASGRLGCGSCHGNPPGYADGSPKANGHLKHSTDCSLCHYSVTANGTGITDKTKHAQYRYDVNQAPGTSFTYSYSATGGSCSSVSCHTNGTAPRIWSANSCGNCHTAPPSDSSHTRHFSGSGRYAAYGNMSTSRLFGYNCGLCHPLNPALDHDGVNQIEFYNPAAPAGTLKGLNSIMSRYSSGSATLVDNRSISYTNGSCRDIYCHSDGTSAGTSRQPVSARVVWNGNALGCNSCHNTVPNYANGSPKANSHNQHYQQFVECWDCHNNVTASSYSITDKSRHANGRYDLSPSSGKSFSYAFNPAGGGSCSTVSCHNDGTKVATGTLRYRTMTSVWGGPSKRCSGCHGYPPDYANGSPKKNNHSKHAVYGCQVCHSYTTYNGTYTSTTYHRNGTYNINGTGINSYTFSASGSSCYNSCHGNGTSVTTGYIQGNSQPKWGDGALGCWSCHQMPPAYADGSPKPNAHTAHSGYSCKVCHYSVTTTGDTVTDPTRHANLAYDLLSDGSASFDYTFGTNGSSCANVSCHTTWPRNTNWSRYAKAPASITPANMTENLPVNTTVRVVFGEDMDPGTINATTFRLQYYYGTWADIPGTVSYDPATRTATYTPAVPLDYYNQYYYTISSDIRSATGGVLKQTYNGYFTTSKTAQFGNIYSVNNFTNITTKGSYSWSAAPYTPTPPTNLSNPYWKANEGVQFETWIQSPVLDFSNHQSVEIRFASNVQLLNPGSYAWVELSENGAAGPWNHIWFLWNYNGTATSHTSPSMSWNLSSQLKGKNNVMLRFRLSNDSAYGATATLGSWGISNVTFSGDPR